MSTNGRMAGPEPLNGQSPSILPGVIGESTQLRAAARQVALFAETDATCLLLGETGTGKELFARAVHYLSSRKHRPFVPLNCGAVPDQLFENELFGHARGAYTDARSQETGLLAYAENGSLFLDEVDALSPSAQVKLLRVLQEREYRPVGSPRTVPTNIRVVAATNSNLLDGVRTHRFREDLYFRLNILTLTVPPLRERLSDIPLLTAHFVAEYSSTYKRSASAVDPAAMEALTHYSWPGNIRELQSVLQRAVLTAPGSSLNVEDLGLLGSTPRTPGTSTLRAAKTVAINQFERKYLTEVLERSEGNVTLAARMAGKERRSFQRLLRKYSIA